MLIQENKVVTFHYTLTGPAGETLDSTLQRGEPMRYLHGANNIITGLEAAMAGREAGDRFNVTVPPEEAYGAKREPNIQRLSLKKLGVAASQLKTGMIMNLQTSEGPAQVTVVKIGRFNVDVDANHPLAGQELTFDVEIVEVRDATEEELRHGHAHGSAGQHHS